MQQMDGRAEPLLHRPRVIQRELRGLAEVGCDEDSGDAWQGHDVAPRMDGGIHPTDLARVVPTAAQSGPRRFALETRIASNFFPRVRAFPRRIARPPLETSTWMRTLPE